MSEIRLNWDVVIQLLAQGNPFIWLLLAISLLCLGVLAWIKYEQPIRRLASLILNHCSKKYRAKAERQLEIIELCDLRYEKFAEKIYGLICRIADLRIDADQGRNKFYQYLIKTMFEAFSKASRPCITTTGKAKSKTKTLPAIGKSTTASRLQRLRTCKRSFMKS